MKISQKDEVKKQKMKDREREMIMKERLHKKHNKILTYFISQQAI